MQHPGLRTEQKTEQVLALQSLTVILIVNQDMHTRIMVGLIDRVQHVILIREHEPDLHEGKRPNVNHVMQSQQTHIIRVDHSRPSSVTGSVTLDIIQEVERV